jgi:hypothetical protein
MHAMRSSLARRAAGFIAAAAVAAAVAACGSASSSTPPKPGGTAGGVPSQGGGCVDKAQATQIWTDIDNKLNAMEADPKHADPSTVTTGAALQGVQLYLNQQLIANNWTEHEVDKLESITVVNAGCNSSTLQLRVTMTLVTDDYLDAGGKVDHQDPSTGQTLHFLNFYQRSGGTWKETEFQNLDQPGPSQSPQII